MIKKRLKKHRMKNTPSLKDSALLIIDMQYFFCKPGSHAYIKDAPHIIRKIQVLLNVYREEHLPVIYTRHALLRSESPGAMGRWWRDTLYDDEERSAIDDRIKPLPGEIVIRKTRYSAFYDTDLEKILKNSNINSLVITGVLTHLCCESTARDAFIRDYNVFLVIDATASDDKKLYNASLLTLSDGFAKLVKTNEVIEWLRIKK
ncbi:MAG: isochorismatase family cysteine hydrolase [Candidatus Thermoplasmatota archaeon]